MKFTTAMFLAAMGLCCACNLMPGQGGSPAASGGKSAAPDPAAVPVNAPGWVTAPDKHPSYPREKFMTATGHAMIEGGDLGLAHEKAIANGKVQISSELNTNIKAETEIYMREVSSGDEYASTSDYSEKIRSQTESLLFGAKQGADFVDRAAGSVYVLVVLDRAQHAQALLKKVRSELAKASGEADQSTAAGKLQALIKEHVILESVMPSLITLAVALPGQLPVRAEFEAEYDNVKTRMRAIITQLNDQEVALRVVSGAGQKGYATEKLAEPIVFEATAGGKPLVGFPVRFELEYPERAELVGSSSTTDASGRFSTRVAGLGLTGDEENEVSGLLDYRSFKEAVLRAPAGTVSYLLPTLATSTFAISVEETNLDKVLPESGVRSELAAALTKREVKLIDLSAVLSGADAKKAATADTDWVKQKLAGKVDYLIRGTARSRASAANSMGIAFSYAGGAIEMIDVRTGVKAASYEVQPSSSAIKKSGSNHEDAGSKALKEFGEQVARAFMPKIDAVFQIE